MKNLFLRQSYLDSWEDYENSLRKPSFIKWDYIILTASNEEQARTYREQIDYRLAQGLLPAGTHYAVLPRSGWQAGGIRRRNLPCPEIYCGKRTAGERG